MGILSTLFCAVASSANAQETARIVEVAGKVTHSKNRGETWTEALAGRTLKPYDRLRTGTNSRAACLWSDQTVIALGPLTEIEVLPQTASNSDRGLHLISGIASFFHNDPPGSIHIFTRGAIAGVEGTEFIMSVGENGTTTISVLDGRVSFSNAVGAVILTNGQQAVSRPGIEPVSTSGFIANNVLQWSFYYPAVLDVAELPLTEQERRRLSACIQAYDQGDILAALALYPADDPNTSTNERLFHAALILSVGQVEKTQSLLDSLNKADMDDSVKRFSSALHELIAAVKRQPVELPFEPSTATEALAMSYYEQARAKPRVSLELALNLARQAVGKSPNFGFGWQRVAELEFSFGHVDEALKALQKALQLAPRNPEALALEGFLLAAQDNTDHAILWFDRALEIDSSFANAWFGRGLCRIAKGSAEAGRKDLLVAAALEPQRAELRSYLGKAYANANDDRRAQKELLLAMSLDPHDPTGWYYLALLRQQENRINDAIKNLQESEALNDNRMVYRSQLLLDQDRAARSANLASVYQDAGMNVIAVREAQRAVDDDYANYASHLFLANSYGQLVDPNEISLRYETAMESEYLLANLLSPASAGTMSQATSQQEFSRLFEGDHMGVVSDTEYLSRGAWSEVGAQYGVDGKTSYNVEGDYRYDPGQRPNDDFTGQSLAVTLKQEFSSRDTGFFRVLDYKSSGGDNHQYYSANMSSPDFRFTEFQEPDLLLGYHHEEGPGAHTLLLFARLNDTVTLTNPAQPTILEYTPKIGRVETITSAQGLTMNEFLRNDMDIYSAELQQILQTDNHRAIFGARGQYGEIETTNMQNMPSIHAAAFSDPAAHQFIATRFDRLSVYGYYEWQAFDPLRLISGVTYDNLVFPANVQTAPLSETRSSTGRVTPKFGLVFTPDKDTAIRIGYARSVGGMSVDQSYQIEPSEVAGFTQSFRSVIPESVAAESPGAEFEIYALSITRKFFSGTYLALDANLLNSKDSQETGAFDLSYQQNPLAIPGGLSEVLSYHEKTAQFTAYQALGTDWTFGGQYRITQSVLINDFPDVPSELPLVNFQRLEATLSQAKLFTVFNHSSGCFGEIEAVWNGQYSDGYSPGLGSDYFWQFNAYAGYRFYHRKAEVRVGLLNLTDQNYFLNPLNPHLEYPYSRTVSMRLRLNF